MSPRTLGYEVVSIHSGAGVTKPTARFRCVECGRTGDFPLIGSHGSNPEAISNRANRDGWVTSAFRKPRTYCPRCAGPSKTKHDPDSELKKVTPMSVSPIKPVEVREPTPDQRVAIRGHLDKSFDDAVGMYLDGLTDQRVAELCGVPRIIVERMRETAYGPIRVDPLVAALRTDMTTLKMEIDGQQRGMDTLKAKVSEISSRLEKVAMGRVV